MDKILSKDLVIIDGSISSELENLRYDLKPSVFWTAQVIIDNPEIAEKVHLNFLKSGAEIIETISYQLNQSNLMNELQITAEEAKEILKRSVKVAKDAKIESGCENALIAGSIGPYGACKCDGSEFDGSYVNHMTIEELIEWHKPRFEALIEAGVDLLAIETIPSVKEADALCELLSQYPEIKAWLSFSCKNDSQISIGETFNDAYNRYKNHKQLIAIGVNCLPPIWIENLLKSVENPTIPFIVYPNNAIWDSLEKTYKNIGVYENYINQKSVIIGWIKYGAKYIGGCCGNSARMIGNLKSTLLI